MSRFFSKRHETLSPYVPGEQPKDRRYIKLNTNESPFPPSPSVAQAVCGQVDSLMLYSDPECRTLKEKFAEVFAVRPSQVMFVNGSDEALDFVFWAFCDEERPLAFPDITYGFYPVFAALHHIPYEEIPLTEDFSVDVEDYAGIGKNIVLANPNAPSGRALSRAEIERIVASNPDNIVLIDEAYVDFGGESALPLIDRYDNLLVCGTFSKSRSMAGARLGYVCGCEALIGDLNTLRYATNPYNVNRLTEACGIAALTENEYYMKNCREIAENRGYVTERLTGLGFSVIPSCTNFVFARSDRIDGETLYKELKARGILVRHFAMKRIAQYNRITIGRREDMDTMLAVIADIVKEMGK